MATKKTATKSETKVVKTTKVNNIAKAEAKATTAKAKVSKPKAEKPIVAKKQTTPKAEAKATAPKAEAKTPKAVAPKAEVKATAPKAKKQTTPKVEAKTPKAEAKTAPKAKKQTTPKAEVKATTAKAKKQTAPKAEKPIVVKTTKQTKVSLVKTATELVNSTKKSNGNTALRTLIDKECKKSVKNMKNTAKLLHHDICMKLNDLQTKTNYPIGVLVYLAVGTSAHKAEVFNNGYTNIDTAKAKRVIGYCKNVANTIGNPRIATNDKLVHAMARFDSIFKGAKFKSQRLNEALATLKIEDGFKFSQFKTAHAVNKFIFEKVGKFNEKGALVAE